MQSIEAYSMISLNNLGLIYLQYNLNLTISNNSLNGMESIQVICISFESLFFQNNYAFLIESIFIRKKKEINSVIYYKSIDITAYKTLLVYKKNECE